MAPIGRALEGSPPGLVGIQLRAKDASDRQLVVWGKDLRELTSAAGSPFVVNRRPDVARIVAADGVHLPERGLRPQDVARHFPDFRLIGVSRHDRAGLERAEREGASYAFLSPIYDVPGKAPPMGIEGFGAAIQHVGIPTFALGGVTHEHIRGLMRVGAYGIAIRRAIYGASDPERALGRFLSELDKGPRTGE